MRLDDGKSNPVSIAMGVAGACAGQYSQFGNSMVGGMSTEGGQTHMRDQMRTIEPRLATSSVLTYRAAERSQ